MAVNNVAVRIGLEGGEVVKRELVEIGTAGEVALGKIAPAAEKASAGLDRLTTLRAKALREAIDPIGAAQGRMAASIQGADDLLAKGAITTKEHTAALVLARTGFDQFSRSAKVANDNLHGMGKTTELASHQVQNLRAQLLDVGTSLSGGMSPLQVLMQQGGQIAGVFGPGQGGVLGILRGISQAIPRGLAVGGAAGSVLAIPLLASERYQREQQEDRRSVLGVGRGSGITARDIESSAGQPFTFQGGLSVAQGRDLGRAITQTGYGSPGSISLARDMARDLSATLAEPMEEVNQRFTALFKDPVQGADQLNARLGFLTGSTRDYIKSLSDQGRNTEAAEVAMRAMTGTLGKYSELTGSTSQAFDKAKTAFSDWIFAATRGGDRIISSLGDLVTKHEDTADRVVRAEQRQTDAIKSQTEEQVRRIRDRAEALSVMLTRDNLLARRDPLSQSIYQAQREAGVQPPLTNSEREAERGLTDGQRTERERQAAIIARQVVERNSIDLGKQLIEQSRSARLTMEGEVQAIGLTVRESERLRFEIAARIGAGQGGKAISAEIEAQIKREAAAYGEAAEGLARLRVQDALRFDRGQLGRTSGEQAIATALRSQGLGTADDPANAALVSTLRLNRALGETKSIASESLKGFIGDLKAGTAAGEALANVLSRIGDRLLDKTLDSMLSGLFKTGDGKSGSGDILGSIFGAITKGTSEPTGGERVVADMAVQAAKGILPKAIVMPVARVEARPLSDLATATGDGALRLTVNPRSYATTAGGDLPVGFPTSGALTTPTARAAYESEVSSYLNRMERPFAPTLPRPGDVDANSPQGRMLKQGYDVPGLNDSVSKYRPDFGGLPEASDRATEALDKLSKGVDESGNKLVESFQSLASGLGSGGSSGGLFSSLFGGRGSSFEDAGFADGLGAWGAHASGGYITGPGGPRDDLIPARLSNGEYVIQADVVGRYGRGFFDRLNDNRPRRFADGGYVGTMPLPVPSGGGAEAPITFNMTTNVDATGSNLTEAQVRAIVEAGHKRSVAQLGAHVKVLRGRGAL